MLSQIHRSTTLSIYVALNSNETAVATFAWLNAGWHGMNVTRACHILNSQINALHFSRRIAEHPNVSSTRIAAIVNTVNAMSPAEVEADYGKYLVYVRSWCDKEKKPDSCYTALLKSLYDPRTTQTIPLSYRRALLVQERVRALMNIPTWSATTNQGTLAKR